MLLIFVSQAFAADVSIGELSIANQQSSAEKHLSKYPSLYAALAEIGTSNNATLVVSEPAVLSKSAVIPLNVALRITNNGGFNIAAGQTLTIRGIVDAPLVQIFSGAGDVDLSAARVEKLYPDWFAPANTADWSQTLVKVSKIASAQGGNTIKFVCGKTYPISTPLNVDFSTSGYNYEIHWQGCATDAGNSPPNILYTGSGANSAVTFKSVNGLRIKNMKIQYNNPGFTGYLVDLGKTVRGVRGGNGGDSAYVTIEDSTLTGTEKADKSSGLIYTGGTIISRIRTNHFFWARVGVRGMAAGASTYAYVMRVEGNSFNSVTTAIMNPSSNWIVDGNTFEPNQQQKIFAINNDCGTVCSSAQGITYSNNYHADGTAQTEPIVRFANATAVNITGNWWYSDDQVSRAAITLDRCEGVFIYGNHIQAVQNALETVGATSFGITLQNNKINAPNFVLQTTPAVGLNILEPYQGATGLKLNSLNSLVVAGRQTASNSVFNLDLGFKDNAATNTAGQIATLVDAAESGYKVSRGSLGIFAPINGDVEINFFTNNTRRAWINGTALQTTVPFLFAADNAVDIGALNANRPRNGYFGTSLNAPLFSATKGVSTPSLTVNGGSPLTKILSTSASIDFGATATHACEDSPPVALPGAVDGDTLSIGVPSALAAIAGTQFSAFVSGTDQIKVRRCNSASSPATNPPTATIRITIVRTQ